MSGTSSSLMRRMAQMEQLQKQREELESRQEKLQNERNELDSRGNHWAASFSQACKMAACLARWDRAAALPVLREQCRRMTAAMGEKVEGPHSLATEACFVQLLIFRTDAGDLTALDEYAAWLRTARKRIAARRYRRTPSDLRCGSTPTTLPWPRQASGFSTTSSRPGTP